MNRWGIALVAVAATGLLDWYGLSSDSNTTANVTSDFDGAGNAPLHTSASTPHEALQVPSAAARQAANTASAVSHSVNAPARETSFAPIRVPLSYEHQDLIKGLLNSPDNLHAMLEAEPKDAAWAFPMEHAVRLGFEEDVSKGYEIYSAECRKTVCEFQLFGPGGTDTKGLMDALNRHLPFADTGVSFGSGTADGRYALIAYVFRNDSREQPESASQLGASGAKPRRE